MSRTVLILLLLSLPARAASLRVATWTLDWLTLRPPGDPALPADVRPRRAADFARLAFYARRLDADVVALQGVDSRAAAALVFPPHRYRIVLTHDRTALRTGFAIRRGLRFVRHPDLAALAPARSWLRSGADITLLAPGGQRLRLLSVHLKAGCSFSPLRSSRRACAVLARQIPPLAAWAAARAAHGTPFLILGDFNRVLDPRHGRADGLWRRLAAAAPLARAGRGLASPCWGGERFVDQILLGGAARSWKVAGSLRVLVYAEHGRRWRRRLSGHCPVSVRLAVPPASAAPRPRPYSLPTGHPRKPP